VWGSHGDGLGNIVEFSWFVRAIQTGVSWNVDPNLSIPFGEYLGGQPHEPLYFLAQIAIGLMASSVVAQNLLSLLALPAASWAMFRLVLWLTRSPVAAFVSGIGFGCCSYIIANTGGEATLAQIWVFPAVILAILRMLDEPSPRRTVVAALVVTVSAMVNFYYVLFIALGAVVLGSVWLGVGVLERRSLATRSLLAGLAAGAMALSATLAVYQVAIGHLAEHAVRIHRTSTSLSSLAASPVDIVLPPGANPWVGFLRQQAFGLRLLKHPGIYTDFSELSIALPILLLALAGAAIMLFPGWRSRVGLFVTRANVIAILGVAAVGVWLLVPPFGRRYGLTFLSLEYDIWSVAPQYQSFYRAGVLVVLGACVLAGVAIAALSIRSPRAAVAVALLAVLGVFAENFTWPADRVLAVQPLPEYVWVAQHPGDYSMADYPLLATGSGANEYTAEFYQRFHGHPLLNGGIGGTDSESMREEMRDPNRPGVAGALAALNVRYVIWHTDLIRQFAPLNPAYAALLPSYEPSTAGYRLLASFNDGARIFEVTAAPAPAFAFYAEGFGPVQAAGSEGWSRRVESADGMVGVFVGPSGAFSVTLMFTCEASGSPASVRVGRRNWTLLLDQPNVITFGLAAGRGITEVPIAFSSAGGVACSPILAS